jgi:AcrR family transcriptional regulator
MTGRPREFDEGKALAAAMKVFWANGYEGAAYSALTKAMRMNRPSIYGAFGDKEELFLRVIDRYAELYAAPALVKLNEGSSCRESLGLFFQAMIKNMVNKHHLGCLITTVLGDATTHSPKFQTKLKNIVSTGDSLLAARLRRAIDDGELSKRCDALMIARILNNIVNGFALRARAGEKEEDLFALAQASLDAVFLRA